MSWKTSLQALLSRPSRAALEASVTTTQASVVELRAEVARMEGLLDVAGDDIDGPQHGSLYRSLGTAAGQEESRDFPDAKRRKIIGLSHLVYALRGHGESLIDSHIDFMIGDQIAPKANEDEEGAEELQEALDELWEDRRSNLLNDHETLSLSFLLDGELIFRADPSTIDGHVELGWIDPLRVERVLQDERGFDSFVLVSTKAHKGRPDRLFVLNNLDDDLELRKLEVPTKDGHTWAVTETSIDASGVRMVTRSAAVDGFVIYGAWNRPKGATRGRGELTSVLDQIDLHDELVFSTAEVQNLKRWFLMHVKDPSILTAPQAKKKLKEMGLSSPPRNPKVLATNDKVEIEILNQGNRGVSEKWLAQELGTIIFGAKGLPETWRGSMAESNLAGARAADFLPLRRLRRKQRRLLRYWKRVLEIELQLKARVGAISEEIAEGDFSLVTMEVGGKDKERGATMLKEVTAAVGQAELAGVGVKKELLHALIIGAAKELGLPIPSGAEEFDQAAIDEAKKSAEEARALEATVAQLNSQNARKDGDGNQDEEDRDRNEESGRKAS